MGLLLQTTGFNTFKYIWGTGKQYSFLFTKLWYWNLKTNWILNSVDSYLFSTIAKGLVGRQFYMFPSEMTLLPTIQQSIIANVPFTPSLDVLNVDYTSGASVVML